MPMNRKNPAPRRRFAPVAKEYAMVMELPFILVASVLVGGGIGWLLDRKLHTAPWLLLAGGAIGFVGGMRELLRRLTSDDG
jgi:F0F1-type ATP synthase assembly protein I